MNGLFGRDINDTEVRAPIVMRFEVYFAGDDCISRLFEVQWYWAGSPIALRSAPSCEAARALVLLHRRSCWRLCAPEVDLAFYAFCARCPGIGPSPLRHYDTATCNSDLSRDFSHLNGARRGRESFEPSHWKIKPMRQSSSNLYPDQTQKRGGLGRAPTNKVMHVVLMTFERQAKRVLGLRLCSRHPENAISKGFRVRLWFAPRSAESINSYTGSTKRSLHEFGNHGALEQWTHHQAACRGSLLSGQSRRSSRASRPPTQRHGPRSRSTC